MNTTRHTPSGEIAIFEALHGDVRVEVRLHEETAWLNVQQMADVFDRDRSVVSRQTCNAFSEGELDRGATCASFAQVRPEGERTVTMFGEPLYRSREEKAANLLYFVVKDPPFTDRNKRIGALLLLLYLAQERVSHGLDPRALTALTLLIAESAPSAKDLMIRLVVNSLVAPSA